MKGTRVQSRPRPLHEDLYLVRGRKQVLELAPVLEAFAQHAGQLGAMHWLGYFLSTRSVVSKPPYLILQLVRNPGREELRVEDIRAAALFFEYRIAGIRTRVFSTDDAVGYRTVIAAPHERDRFARRAVQALLDTGAHTVLANYASDAKQPTSSPDRGVLTGWRQRTAPRILPLAPTFEATLAQFGHTTRFNLRYYRRRLSKRTETHYVADARPHITPVEFASLNADSLNPVASAHEVELRWKCSCELRDSFVVGLRSSEGKWLSLIGGWRQGTVTVVHWQMNAAGYEQDSIGTVMRSFFIEDEIARGARELLIYGGTPHTINRAFTRDTIVDLLVCRDSLRTRICRIVAAHLNRRAGLRSNHLLCTLNELELRSWQEPAGQITAPSRASVASSL